MNPLLPQLSTFLPPARIKSRPIDRIAYAHDASYFHLVPQVVVQPDSISEVQALLKFSQQNHIAMTFRAAGTSLSGQAVTDGILVDISKHWGRYNVEEGGALIRCQPGIIGTFLNNVLKASKRRIGPDPASIDACMMGGILANNSSGMCCGVTENAYKTIHSMTIVLPNGLVIDTSAPDAAARLHEGAPEIERGLLEISERIFAADSADYAEENPTHPRNQRPNKKETLADRIRRRYQTKNTNGYALNAFIDFDTPLDILTHLMIGSEGTLGFIAEAVLHTLPDYPRKYTAQLYFKNIQDAARAIAPLRDSGARAAEIMDRASLRAVQDIPGVPAILRQLPESAAAILVEYQATDDTTLDEFKRSAARTLPQIALLHDAEFTSDPAQQAILWKARKGMIASVGGMRLPGTTLLTEDIVFPVPLLADGITDLQALFRAHGYDDAIIFGHARDGNLHFVMSQSFNTAPEIARFDGFMQDLVRLVSGKYDGALKAEHGTGRNMAPFVETEWGAEGYAIMRDLKNLFDPGNTLSPGVIINPNPRAHVENVKSTPTFDSAADKCIECGFCESKCPSRMLTLTPRQRISVLREISRLQALDSSAPQLDSVPRTPKSPDFGLVPDKDLLSVLQSSFQYDGLDTCAVDGLCATACPVSINTGDLIKRLRSEQVKGEKIANWISGNFSLVEKSLGFGIRVGHLGEKLVGANGIQSITAAAEKLTGSTLPKWNSSVPSPTKNFRDLGILRGEKHFIYFPSCVSRQLGLPKGDCQLSLAETLLVVAKRANLGLSIPPDVAGHCCGMPFGSKGYKKAFAATLHKTLEQFWAWSEHGKSPIVIDTTSCTHTLRTCSDILSQEDKAIWQKLTLLDGVEFLHDFVLPKIEIHPVDEDVVLHPNCSARKLNLQDKMTAIAQKCARSVTVPLNLGCCAFAGDRGLLFPELTRSATQLESAEVNAHDYGGYYSSNITCEMGMREATGKDYVSIVYLVERASRG